MEKINFYILSYQISSVLFMFLGLFFVLSSKYNLVFSFNSTLILFRFGLLLMFLSFLVMFLLYDLDKKNKLVEVGKNYEDKITIFGRRK